MALTLVGKLALLCLTVAVAVGMTFTIIRTVNYQDPLDVPSVDQPGGPDTPPALPVDPDAYEVGVGIADMTGPIVEITFMGYAELSQSGRGLHLRQFSRAFIFKKGDSRVVLVSAEVQAVGIHVRREVVKKLQAKFGDIYNLRNVIVTGTHTHSAPGGHLVDFLLDVSILGFSSETFNAYVDGITRSIVRAHKNMVPARLYFGQTTVSNVHINRSNYSYEYNPPEERARYPANTDDTLTQLRITRADDGSLHGVLNWFAVHTTSMNMTNLLVSSDNLGYAALALEKSLNPYSLAGKPEIVAAFFSANLGDVSPNTEGARCEFSGEPCDNQFLLCGGSERCYSLGPGVDMFDSTRIIGEAVFQGALDILGSPGEELLGDIHVVHQFVEMPEEVAFRYDPVNRTFTEEKVHGCVPAMGYSFASGTIDGANTLNITQGTIHGNPLLDTVSGVIASPTEEDVACHAPKPILLATGRANFPLPWHPRIVSVSLLWLAGLVVAGVPGEPTTTTGRRIRDVVGQIMEANDIEPRVVVSGLTNEYIHYVATYEEYQVQRYEAASTIYGPYTLDILLNKFAEYTWAVINETSISPGPEPAESRNNTISLITPVILDSTPSGLNFGDVLEQPPPSVRIGDIVQAVFVGANPRNDLKQESTHAEVQALELGQWRTVANDADWSTKFYWERTSTLTGTSQVTFEWTVPESTERGTFRLVYHGVRKSLIGNLANFTSISNPFYVEPIHT